MYIRLHKCAVIVVKLVNYEFAPYTYTRTYMSVRVRLQTHEGIVRAALGSGKQQQEVQTSSCCSLLIYRIRRHYNETPFRFKYNVVVAFKKKTFFIWARKPFIRLENIRAERRKSVGTANSEITQRLFHKHVYSYRVRCIEQIKKKRLNT